ncbi:MAG: pentapeptide repeat-containing protein [Microcystis aeruginosa S11-01]|nr:pentapeptide repeat-containing protein [Microcystis aeruginosa S11-05]NCR49952.1 pentapeptide repeat-containing protein [Microcystis aeruginosa S11-01]
MTASEIARLIIRIEETVNPDSEYYGKLVKWWEQEKELWHYGIGLSNTHFFNIGTIEAKELQILKRHDIIEHDIIEHDIIEHRNLDIRGVPGIYSLFESDEIIERLKYSLRWLNDLPENSSKKKINGKALAFLIFTDDEAGTDKDSEPIDIDFASYLKQQSPRLKHNIIRDFFEKRKNWLYILFGFLIVAAIALMSGEFGSDQPWIKWVLSGAFSILLVIIISNWISNFKWSGFQKKSFWDWLQLLIVPLMLAFAAFYLSYASETRDKQIAEERKQQELLKDYFSKMQTLILAEKTLPKSNNKPTGSPSLDQDKSLLSQASQDIARALTLAVLDELDGPRKGKVITYLAESNLINKPKPEIKLDRANLQDIVLQDVDMGGVKINKADMTKANLTDVSLINADLTLSIFSSATLQKVNFSGATLDKSNFYNTKLKNITISTSSKFQNVCYSEGTKFENTEDDKNQITWLKLTDFQNPNTNSRITKTDRWCKPTEQNLKKNLD